MKTIKKNIRADRREIAYLRYTVESYDGMAVVSTIDPHEALLEIRIAPGCEKIIDDLLDELRHKENITIQSP